jgi:hypothetical protein
MSIKTLRKRIALVAVSALGVGLLSVAPASATGVFVTAGITVNGTTIVAPTGTTTSQTVTIGSNSSVSITAVAGTDGQGRFIVSGGTITAASGPNDSSTILSTPTRFVFGDTTARVTFTPDAGSTRMVISSYVDTSAFDASTEAAELVVTIKTGAVGVVSPADSFVSVVAAATTADPVNNVDVATARSVAVGTNGRINFVLKDANDVELGSSAVVTTTSTAGCLVGSTDATTSFLSASVSTAYGTADEVFVARATTNTPATCTLTMSVNGVALGTKTITLQGKVTKLEVVDGQAGISNAYSTTSDYSGDGAGVSDEAFAYDMYDSANNRVIGLTPTFVNTATSAFSQASNSAVSTATASGLGDITCTGAARGSGEFQMTYVNNAGETIKSPVYKANCFGVAVNYKASLDKATYVPGDIATLTITATDASGNPTNDYVYLGGAVDGGTGSTNPVSISGSNMTAVTAPTSVDKFTSGKKTYKFIVGSTEGNYQMVVDLPKFNNTTYSQVALNVPYSIKAPATGAVTNAEVLAAIVKLIASINKQIRALQKSLKR